MREVSGPKRVIIKNEVGKKWDRPEMEVKRVMEGKNAVDDECTALFVDAFLSGAGRRVISVAAGTTIARYGSRVPFKLGIRSGFPGRMRRGWTR